MKIIRIQLVVHLQRALCAILAIINSCRIVIVLCIDAVFLLCTSQTEALQQKNVSNMIGTIGSQTNVECCHTCAATILLPFIAQQPRQVPHHYCPSPSIRGLHVRNLPYIGSLKTVEIPLQPFHFCIFAEQFGRLYLYILCK